MPPVPADAIGAILPSALAIALSPIPIVAVVVVLGGPHARSSGPAFALGWIAGLVTLTAALTMLLTGGDTEDDAAGALDALMAAIGAVFLVLAVLQWRSRPAPGEQPKTPGWMSSVDAASPPTSALLGASLSTVNPKNLALVLTGAASIAQAGLSRPDAALAVGAFTGVASVSVVGAVTLYLVAPQRAAAPLAAIRRFMTERAAVVLALILLALGLKFLAEGLGGLL
jgi:hypothetical protein